MLESVSADHVCTPLLFGRQMGEWIYLEPDEEDLKYATYILLKPCPACGFHAGPPISKMRQDNGLVQTEVGCSADTRCGFRITYNGYTKSEARTKAIERWDDRRPIAERTRDW